MVGRIKNESVHLEDFSEKKEDHKIDSIVEVSSFDIKQLWNMYEGIGSLILALIQN